MSELPKGFLFKKPSEKAPDFIKGKISINMNDFMEWADKHQKNGWLNIDLLESKDGKYYPKLNDFVPKDNGQAQEDVIENIPF